MQWVKYWRNTTFEIFSSLSVMYPTSLNVLNMARGEANLNEAGTTNNNSGKSPYAYFRFGTVLP